MSEIRTSSCSVTGKKVVARLMPGTDLLAGLVQVCRDNGIKAGCITAIHGSLSKARFVWALPAPGTKMNAKYGDPVDIEGPLEFISGSGMIGQFSDSKELVVHLHGVLSDPEQGFHGAHFVEGGNPVMSTMEVLIEGFDNVDILRAFDEETEFPLFNIYEKGE
jgi:hypothetical protein